MSSLKKSVFLSVFGAAMTATVAFAADLPAPPIIEYEPETPIEIGSSWYLRGDLGYAVHTGGETTWVDGSGGLQTLDNEKVGNTWVAGLGVGYYFNEYFRADLTLDYRHKFKFDATDTCVAPECGGGPITTIEGNKFSAWTLMLNGYYDFGTWYSITPYVGAGAGLAYLLTDTHTTTSGYNFVGGDKVNFAWNVMAGAAFDVSDRLKLDTNYRFVSLGTAETKGVTTAGLSVNPVKYHDLYAHEFRVGLRYDFD